MRQPTPPSQPIEDEGAKGFQVYLNNPIDDHPTNTENEVKHEKRKSLEVLPIPQESQPIFSRQPLQALPIPQESQPIPSRQPLQSLPIPQESQPIPSRQPLQEKPVFIKPVRPEFVQNEMPASNQGKQVLRERLSSNPLQERLSTNPLQERLATNPLQERLSTNPLQERLSTNPLQERLSTNPLQERLSTNPLQERLNSNPQKERLSTNGLQERAGVMAQQKEESMQVEEESYDESDESMTVHTRYSRNYIGELFYGVKPSQLQVPFQQGIKEEEDEEEEESRVVNKKNAFTVYQDGDMTQHKPQITVVHDQSLDHSKPLRSILKKNNLKDDDEPETTANYTTKLSQDPDESLLFEPPYASTKNLTTLIPHHTFRTTSQYKPQITVVHEQSLDQSKPLRSILKKNNLKDDDEPVVTTNYTAKLSEDPDESLLFEPPYASTKNLTNLVSHHTFKDGNKLTDTWESPPFVVDTPRRLQLKMDMLSSMGFSPAAQRDSSKVRPVFLSVIAEKSKESLCESFDQVNMSTTVDTKNPYNQKNIHKFLSRLSPSLHTYPGYHLCHDPMPVFRRNHSLTLGGSVYKVEGCIGEGAFSRNYHLSGDVVAKTQKSTSAWEFYITRELHKRLVTLHQGHLRGSVMEISEAFFFTDGSIFLNQLHHHGNLLDLVNIKRQKKVLLPEWFLSMLVYQLLSVVQAVHECHMLHGDLKVDNVLIRLAVVSEEESLEEMCEKNFLIKLIDFGEAIDLKMFQPGTLFIAKKNKVEFQCKEMREGLPWSYQLDNYMLASLLFMLLTGTYMKESKLASTNTWSSFFKAERSWSDSGELKELLDALINCTGRLQLQRWIGVMRGRFRGVSRHEYNQLILTLIPLLKKN